MARIVLATFGSWGDVHPYLAVGRGLVARGHVAVLAGPAAYREAAEAAGLAFHPVRPDVDLADEETLRRAMHPRKGIEVVVRELLVPALRDSYRDLEAACAGADLLTSHVLTYAAPILGEASGLPWLSTVLSPMVFGSSHEPPALAPLPGFARLHVLGPRVVRVLWRTMMRVSWSWSAPIRELRRERGLDATADPLWEGQFSSRGTLALFSSAFAAPQPDWPERTTVCGFAIEDRDFGGDREAERLEAFLAAGDPPLVFSLGSSGTWSVDGFGDLAIATARRLGRRAVLITGEGERPTELPDHVLAVRSAAVTPLFSRSALVVHAGGVGMTARALLAGRPQIIMPLSHDHFDNARRVRRLGVGGELRRRAASARRLTTLAERLLGDEEVARATDALSERLRAEDGVVRAADAIEAHLSH